MLHIKSHVTEWQFLVFTKDVKGLGIIRNRLCYNLSGISRNDYSIPELLDLILDVVYINIAHNDDTLVIWAIPLLVIIAQCLIRELIYNLHQTDWQTLTILRVRIELW